MFHLRYCTVLERLNHEKFPRVFAARALMSTASQQSLGENPNNTEK
jgi:hypothetical protein